MALLRLLSLPSTSQFSAHYFFSPTPSFPIPPTPSTNSCICFYTSPLSHPLSLKTQRRNLYLFPVSSTATEAEEATIVNPQLKEQQKEEEEEEEASGTRLLVLNVPWTSTPDDIRPLFEKYGTVLDIELSMYKKTRNRGLAFISMSSHEEALAAFNNLEAYEFEGRTLKLAWAKPKKEKPAPPEPKPAPIHNLFVANLPFQARAKDLREFFNDENANVVSAEVIFNENPRASAGYGFVSFNTKEEAEAALSFNGKAFMGRSLRVARSKKFLRQGTKTAIQSGNAASELNPNDEELVKIDEV